MTENNFIVLDLRDLTGSIQIKQGGLHFISTLECSGF